MDLPLLVSPDKLHRLSEELAVSAGQLGRIADQTADLGAQGWQGRAERAFCTASQAAGARCHELSRRLASDAAKVERLEEQLAAELAVLDRLEHEVLGALHRLAARAVDDLSGEAHSLLDQVRARLPGHGSPGWRELAGTLAHGGWL